MVDGAVEKVLIKFEDRFPHSSSLVLEYCEGGDILTMMIYGKCEGGDFNSLNTIDVYGLM